jgi:hypothetical protein
MFDFLGVINLQRASRRESGNKFGAAVRLRSRNSSIARSKEDAGTTSTELSVSITQIAEKIIQYTTT